MTGITADRLTPERIDSVSESVNTSGTLFVSTSGKVTMHYDAQDPTPWVVYIEDALFHTARNTRSAAHGYNKAVDRSDPIF